MWGHSSCNNGMLRLGSTAAVLWRVSLIGIALQAAVELC